MIVQLKSLLSALYKFLGGVYFAIILITLSAFFVIVGTLIESKTDSHLFAAEFTYGHPLFNFLLMLFFVNITLSTLRRWPFKKKHIPFIITHIGLLLILTGQLVKSRYGLQGSMGIKEGAASSTVFLPHTFALQITTKSNQYAYLLEKDWKGQLIPKLKSLNPTPPPFNVELSEFKPHAKMGWQNFIKGDELVIAGIKPFSLNKWSIGDPLPKALSARLHHENSPTWQIRGALVENLESASIELYLQEMTLKLTLGLEKSPFYEGSLKNFLDAPPLPFSAEIVFNEPFKNAPQLTIRDASERSWHLDLSSSSILKAKSSGQENTPLQPGLTIELQSPRRLYFLYDGALDKTAVLAIDPHGRYFAELYDSTMPESFISYDDGYFGYFARFKMPFPAFDGSWRSIKEARLHEIGLQIREILSENGSNSDLCPPLEVFRKNTAHFEKEFIELLSIWEKANTWLFPIQANLSPAFRKTLEHVSAPLSDKLKKGLKKFTPKETPLENWQSNALELSLAFRLYGISPEGLLAQNENNENEDWRELVRTHLASMLFVKNINQNLKKLKNYSPVEKAAFLESFPIDAENSLLIKKACKTYLENTDRAHLALNEISLPLAAALLKREAPLKTGQKKIDQDDLKHLEGIIETPLTTKLLAVPATKKIEENTPLLGVIFKQQTGLEKLKLLYDPYATGLMWPALDGQLIARFQPQTVQIPYTLRLKHARQICYPNSTQAYSYECDLYIKGPDGQNIEQTLSMNHVYETWDGYRFYLASMHPPDESRAKSIQIVVNRDPGKYWFTYPGALLLALGIVLLFARPKIHL